MYLRPDFTKKDNFIYPSFQRVRQALRAPMRSGAVNLEDHQLSFDIYNLTAKFNQFETDMKADVNYIQNESGNLEALKSKVNNLRKRLDLLEGKD